jgi:hypothetical protein
LSYADYARSQQEIALGQTPHEVLTQYMVAHPEDKDLSQFAKPVAGEASTSWKLVGYLGFGGFGPVLWNNFFVSFQKVHPDQFYTETVPLTVGSTVVNKSIDIFVQQLTDQRYRLDLGNEMRLQLVPGFLDVAWGVLAGNYWNDDNKLAPGDDNRTFWSTVLRAQAYVTETVHFLAETSYAQEHSTNGNLYRNEYDSIFQSTRGEVDAHGLEFGDSATRITWQGKIGPVFSPLGTGIYTRPAIRLLYGVQYSSQNDAFGSSFATSLADFNSFRETASRHWHHVVALETEAWF